MGSEYVKTPHMDTLANSGVLFTNGYVPDNHCRPALQSLITGMLPYNFNRKRDSLKQIKKNDSEQIQRYATADTACSFDQDRKPMLVIAIESGTISLVKKLLKLLSK